MTKEKVMELFNLTSQQAEFCVLVASGEKPIEAVMKAYSYSHKTNAYGQLRDLQANKKVDEALVALGLNIHDQQEKQALGILIELQELAYLRTAPIRERLAALKELARYNPILRKLATDETSPDDEAFRRVKEWVDKEMVK